MDRLKVDWHGYQKERTDQQTKNNLQNKSAGENIKAEANKTAAIDNMMKRAAV